ncbi:MAG: DUF4197 domain-containing protein [Syntrophorhabdaceae bacterium]|nr:DUF4197 domain-containing protein [Syntrophorhabdaceae bacterium]
MKHIVFFILFLFSFTVIPMKHIHSASPFDTLLKGIKVPSKQGPDENTTIAGLKEALTIGTGNAVTLVSKTDGYFKNQMIKILFPDSIQRVADVLGRLGYQRQIDEFILSMNRAAENAAPKAKEIFIGAIKEMTFEDAMSILKGNDTAATEYFKAKTSNQLYNAFKPVVSKSLNTVGATERYKTMMHSYEAIPFVSKEYFDLDHYVTNKALDGLFYMVGEEEKKIRNNPAARVTDLLKAVFTK